MSYGAIALTERPVPLRYFYVGKVPLYEALTQARPLGPTQVLDRPCHRFLFEKVRWAMADQDLVYALDDDTGIPLSVTSYPVGQGQAPDAKSQWSWEARSLDTADGYPYVKNSVSIMPHDPTPRPITVDRIVFNQTYPATQFQIKPDPGVLIIDEIRGKDSVAPGTPRPVSSTTAAAQPIVVAQPRSWTEQATPIFLGLGAVLLLSGAVLAWRRR
jgi:hypothetical protein